MGIRDVDDDATKVTSSGPATVSDGYRDVFVLAAAVEVEGNGWESSMPRGL
jgi:hypothetical protein